MCRDVLVAAEQALAMDLTDVRRRGANMAHAVDLQATHTFGRCTACNAIQIGRLFRWSHGTLSSDNLVVYRLSVWYATR